MSDKWKQLMPMAAGQVKMSAGIANNAAWMVVLEAHDHIRKHPNYKHQVKKMFRQVLEQFHAYERGLIYAEQNRMFRVADMEEQTRKIYGNITDREYYDFWTATGANVYTDTRLLVTSLQNKFRLVYEKHKFKHPGTLAWAYVGGACLTLAVQILKLTIDAVHDEYKIPSRACNEVFGQFRLDHIAKTWNEASRLLEPRAHEIALEDIEQKNINQGLQQILEQWGDPVAQVSSVVLNIQEYEEVFRTKGEMKKALRSLRETRDGIRDFIEQDRNSFLLHKMQQQQDEQKDYD
jgi:hypothetical protein